MTLTAEAPLRAQEQLSQAERLYSETTHSAHQLMDLDLLTTPDVTPEDICRNPSFYGPGAVRSDVPVIEHSYHEDSVQVFEVRDDQQPTGSFKVRGAFNMASRAVKEHPDAVALVTNSAGNHGNGVAHFANWYNRQWGVRRPLETHVFCKSTASSFKRKQLDKNGAIVHDSATTFSETVQQATDFRHPEGETIVVPPYDHPDIRAGQSTLMMETYLKLSRRGVDPRNQPLYVYVGVGGGGLLVGNAVLLSELKSRGLVHPDSQVVGVSAENGDSLRRSVAQLDAGQNPQTRLFAEGTFQDQVDGTAVEEPALSHAMLARYLRDQGHLSLATVSQAAIGQEMARSRALGAGKEPAGALARAGQLQDYYQHNLWGHTCVQAVITSGGNVSPETIEHFDRVAQAAVSPYVGSACIAGSTRRQYVRV